MFHLEPYFWEATSVSLINFNIFTELVDPLNLICVKYYEICIDM